MNSWELRIQHSKAYKMFRRALRQHRGIVMMIIILALLDIFVLYPSLHKGAAVADGQLRSASMNDANGWVMRQGKTFYYTKTGEKLRGEQVIDGKSYYFDERVGNMKTGWVTTEKGTRYYSDSGTQAQGAQTIDAKQYYFDNDGYMFTGWQELGGEKYYYDKNGCKCFGRHVIDGQSYFFAKGTGALTERNLDPNRPMIALTFDDGPSGATDVILDQLEAVDGLCTFFIVGNRIEEYEDSVKRAAELGCELANHTWEHAYLDTLDQNGIIEQLEKTNDKIEEVTGVRPTLMRPTGGRITDTLKSCVGMPMIMWSVDTQDWKTKNAQATINEVLNKAYDGAIVLMHDLQSSTGEASKTFIKELVNRGYQLVTVSELSEAKGFTIEDGIPYYDFYRQPAQSAY